MDQYHPGQPLHPGRPYGLEMPLSVGLASVPAGGSTEPAAPSIAGPTGDEPASEAAQLPAAGGWRSNSTGWCRRPGTWAGAGSSSGSARIGSAPRARSGRRPPARRHPAAQPAASFHLGRVDPPPARPDQHPAQPSSCRESSGGSTAAALHGRQAEDPRRCPARRPRCGRRGRRRHLHRPARPAHPASLAEPARREVARFKVRKPERQRKIV